MSVNDELAHVQKLLKEDPTQPSSNGCPCDFCTRKKLYADNWCTYCAEVKMEPPKWWENMDVCDACHELLLASEEEPNGDGT